MKIIEKNFNSLTLKDIYVLKKFFHTLINYYPDVEWWFFNKVITDNNLKLYFLIYEEEINGFLILKNNNKEKKIRCFYLDEKLKNKNISLRMFKFAMKKLNTNQPSFSFPKELKDFYIKFSKIMGFKITQIIKDKYRKGKKEYFVNTNNNNLNFNLMEL